MSPCYMDFKNLAMLKFWEFFSYKNAYGYGSKEETGRKIVESEIGVVTETEVETIRRRRLTKTRPALQDHLLAHPPAE